MLDSTSLARGADAIAAGPNLHRTTADDLSREITFAQIYEKVNAEQTSRAVKPSRRLLAWMSGIAMASGLGLTLWYVRAGGSRSAVMTAIGFGLEVFGAVAWVVTTQTHRAFRRETSDHDDMREYDSFHSTSIKVIEWIASFDPDKIASLRAALAERQNVSDLASGWLLGSAEKLGVFPAAAAIVVQGLTLSRPQGILDPLLSGLITGGTLGFCALTFALTRDRARNLRIDWLLCQGQTAAQAGKSGSASPVA